MFASTWPRIAILVAALFLLVGAESAQPAQPPADDPLPGNAVQRLGTARFRQGSRILTLAYSPDNRLLVSAGGDDPVHIWDATTGLSIRQLPERWVQAVAFSNDGTLLATGGGFKNVKVWEVASGRLIANLKGHKAAISALTFGSDNNTLISASHDKTIKIWDLPNAREAGQLTDHSDEVTCLALGSDRRTLASGGGDRTVRFWDLTTKQILGQVDAGCAVAAVTFVGEKRLASTGDDGMIRIWDVGTRTESKKWKAHDGSAVSLVYNAANHQLVSGGLDRTIVAWNPDNASAVRKIERGVGDADALAVSGNGKTVAAGGGNNTVRRWDLGNANPLDGETGAHGAVSALSFTPDGKTVALGGTDGIIRLYDPVAGRELNRWKTAHRGELFLAVSSDGKHIASAAGPEGVSVWDTAGKELRSFKAPGEVAPVGLAFTPDGTVLAVGYRDNRVLVYRLADEKAQPTTIHQNGVQALAFTADGKKLVLCSSDKAVVWDWVGNQQLKSIKTPPIASVACSSDQRTFATGLHDATIKIWDVGTGADLRTLEGHTSSVFAVAYSTSGQMLASGSYDGTVRVWEAASGQAVNTWKGHRGPVLAVAVSPDGRTCCSGGADASALVWDVTGRSKGGKIIPVDVNGMTEQLWAELAAESIPTAHKSLWTFVAGGENTVEFLHKTVFLVDKNMVEKLIADLDANAFRVRERATIQLERYGRNVEGRLEEASRNPASLEVKLRIEELLRKMRKPGGITLAQERLRARRVLEILEQSGSARAQELLRNLTRGAVETDLSHEAQMALERLARRKG